MGMKIYGKLTFCAFGVQQTFKSIITRELFYLFLSKYRNYLLRIYLLFIYYYYFNIIFFNMNHKTLYTDSVTVQVMAVNYDN